MAEIDELKKLREENEELKRKLNLVMELLSESEILKKRPTSLPIWVI